MVTSCEINFDQNPHGTYFAGQMISGNITLRTDKVKIVKALALKIRGYARASWSENSGTGDKRGHRHVSYSGLEDYIASITYLLGSEDNQNVQIQPGIHTYTFSCAIPPFCPSSFEGKSGHIRYLVKVILLRPWKFDQTYARGFTVLQLLDLNYESPVLRIPACQEIYKTFYCGPCSSKPLQVNVMLPQTGFVAGQSIPITVTVKNESNIPVVDVKMSLIMMVTLFSQLPIMHSRYERTNLAKFRGGAVSTNSTRTITQSIRVPAVPPTCYQLCRILHVTYQIDVEIKLKSMSGNPAIISIPVVIGNVPLVSVVQHQPTPRTSALGVVEASAPEVLESDISERGVFTMPNVNVLPVIDPVRNPLDPLSSAELNILPPSYEEALFMTRADCNEDQHAMGKSEFLPRYPVYNIPDSLPSEEPFTNTDPKKSTWL